MKRVLRFRLGSIAFDYGGLGGHMDERARPDPGGRSVHDLTRTKGNRATSEKPLRRFGVVGQGRTYAVDPDIDSPAGGADPERPPHPGTPATPRDAGLPGPRPQGRAQRGSRTVLVRVRLRMDG